MAPPKAEIQEMNVTDGFDRAVRHSRSLLFKPFDPVIWLCLSLSILLESCGGGSPNFGMKFGNKLSSLNKVLDSPFTVVIIGVMAVVGLAFAVLAAFLGSRGTMMFIQNVATGEFDVKSTWVKVKDKAWRLFHVQVALLLVMFSLGIGSFLVIWLASNGFQNLQSLQLPLIMVMGLFGFVSFLVFSTATCLLRNIIAPIMWKFDIDFFDAFELFKEIASKNAGPLGLFLLIRLGIAIAMGIISVVVSLLTCCIGALPVINQFILAPLYVFELSYSLTVVESLGPDFRIIREKSPEPPPPGESQAP